MRRPRNAGEQCRLRNAGPLLGSFVRKPGEDAPVARDGDYAPHARRACRHGSARQGRGHQRIFGCRVRAGTRQRQLLFHQGLDKQFYNWPRYRTPRRRLARESAGAVPGIHQNRIPPYARHGPPHDCQRLLDAGRRCRGNFARSAGKRQGNRGAQMALESGRNAPENCAGADRKPHAAWRQTRVIIESVPNFSEGRDPVVVAGIARAVASIPGASLLDTTSDSDHNRSVLTFAGSPEAVAAAAFAAVRAAVQSIDISRHAGVHPRIGAADVVPLVPVNGVTLEDCAELARKLGRRIWEELRVPVFMYEAAALRAECRRLENVRRLAPAGHAPDFGTGRHPTAGASVVGARKFLIAWNINLRTTDVSVARAIAKEIRESSGGLPAVKSIGLPLESRGEVQVSI